MLIQNSFSNHFKRLQVYIKIKVMLTKCADFKCKTSQHIFFYYIWSVLGTGHSTNSNTNIKNLAV